MKKNYKLGAAVVLAVGLGLVACGGQKAPAHKHSYVEHAEVPSNCVETGTEFYYTCEGCDKYFDASYEEIEAPVVIPVDPTNHKGEEFLAVSGSYKTDYKIGDTFDMTGITLTLKCEYCEGRKLSATELSKVRVTYPTQGASSFTAEDLVREDLSVTLTCYGSSGQVSAQAPITLTKKSNEITGLSVIERHCGFKPFTELEGVSSNFGTIVYYFSETENGEYKTASELGNEYVFTNEGKPETETTTYYVKAVVEEGPDYLGAEASTTIVISHNDFGWDTTGEEEDVSGCVCSDPVRFRKVLDNPSQEVEVASTASIDMTGSSYDSTKDTVKSITFIKDEEISYDLGTDLTNLDFSQVPEENHGEGEVEIVVTTPVQGSTPEADHTIKLHLLAVTKYIKTRADVRSLRIQETHENVFGYFKMANDITGDENTMAEVYYSNDPNSSSYVTFKGTFDGNGHVLTTKSLYLGLFECVEKSTIKNVTFRDIWSKNGFTVNYSMFCFDLRNSVVENCTFEISNSASLTPNAGVDGIGLIVCRISMNNTYRNCHFNFAGKDIGSLIGFGANKANNTFVDCTLDCASYATLWYDRYHDIYYYTQDGLTINTGVVNSYLEPQTIYLNHDEAQFIDLHATNFEEKQVSKIMLGDYDLGSDLSNLTLTDELKSDVSIRGDQTLFITFEEGFTITLSVNVAFEVEQLDIAAQDIIVTSSSNSISLTGTEYDGDTVTSILMGSYDLGSDLSNIAVPTELAENVSKHGEQQIQIDLIHQGTAKAISIPVILVTKVISSTADMESISTIANAKVYGYYIVGEDFDFAHTTTPTYAWDGTGIGFYGTFDGRGHTISYANGNVYTHGIFGTTCLGAVIKNLNIYCGWYSSSWGQHMLAYTMYGTTLKDVSITVVTNADPALTPSDHGLIVNEAGGLTFENVSVTTKGNTNLCSIIRTINDSQGKGGGTPTTFTNCQITANTIYAIIGTNKVTAVAGWTVNANIFE